MEKDCVAVSIPFHWPLLVMRSVTMLLWYTIALVKCLASKLGGVSGIYYRVWLWMLDSAWHQFCPFLDKYSNIFMSVTAIANSLPWIFHECVSVNVSFFYWHGLISLVWTFIGRNIVNCKKVKIQIISCKLDWGHIWLWAVFCIKTASKLRNVCLPLTSLALKIHLFHRCLWLTVTRGCRSGGSAYSKHSTGGVSVTMWSCTCKGDACNSATAMYTRVRLLLTVICATLLSWN